MIDKLPPHKCGLYIEHNPHRDYYESITDHVRQRTLIWEDSEKLARCVEADELWIMQWYPETPIGFNLVWAPSLEELLRLANE